MNDTVERTGMVTDGKSDGRAWGPAIAKGAFLLLTLVLLGALIYTVRSILHAIILGMLFAVLLMPLHLFILERVERLMRRKSRASDAELSLQEREHRAQRADSRNRSIAAVLTVFFVSIVIVIPVFMFAYSVGRQGFAATLSAQRWLVEEFPAKVHVLAEKYELQEKLEQWQEFYDRLNGDGSGESGAVALSSGLPVSAESSEGVADSSSSSAARGSSANASVQDLSSSVPASVVSSESLSEDDMSLSCSSGEALSAEDSERPANVKDIGPWVSRVVGNVLGWVRDFLLAILSQVWILVFNFCLMMFVMYQFFYDWKNICRYAKSISPLGDVAQRRVSIRLRQVTRAIFFGIFGTAIAQGALAMVAFKLIGIPVFWGVVLGCCSIVPVVGTSIIWVPVTVYLCLIGAYGKAFAVFLCCGCIIANLDMLLRPLLMKKSGDTGLSYMVLFLSIFGGIQSFGVVGVIYGPLIAGLCSICLLLFSVQFKGMKETHDRDDELLESLSELDEMSESGKV